MKQAIDAFVEDQMAVAQMPGLGLCVIQGREVVYERGYGLADIARELPMTERTPVVIGSTTKAMTSAAVLQLMDRGLIELDAPVQRFLPEFQLSDRDAASRVTVRQILSHTAGLPPTATDAPTFVFSGGDDEDALRRYVAELASIEPAWEPGTGFLYANDGYSVAGRLIEVLSGMTYEAYMEKNLFEPLGMRSALFPGAEPPSGTALPYDYGPDGAPYVSFFPHDRASNAAGMLLANVHDAGVWLTAALLGRVADGRRLLSESALREWTRPVARQPGSDAGAGESWYALGWSVSEMAGKRVISHGGSAITMGSHFVLVPDDGLAVAALANSGTDATRVIAMGVANLAQGKPPAASFPRLPGSAAADPALWRRFVGTYEAVSPSNGVSSPLPIELEDGRLVARTYPAGPSNPPGNVHLVPISSDEFLLYGRGKTGGTARFNVNDEGTGMFQGVAIRKTGQRVHRGTVTRWRAGETS